MRSLHGDEYTPGMPESCLFCDNHAGSREHFWPAWIHRRHDFGPLRVQKGTGPEVADPSPERTVNTVCRECNNGWMSKLEEKNVPALGEMLDNEPFLIDAGRQRLLCEWAVMKTMLNDSDRDGNPRFYTREECANMRLCHQIPPRTRLWICALNELHIGAFGTDFVVLDGYGKIRLGMGSVTTIVVGHFGIQVVTIHINDEYEAKVPADQPTPEDWPEMLIPMKLGNNRNVSWPPQVPFTNGGPLGIGYLMQRWRVGDKVAMVTKDGIVE